LPFASRVTVVLDEKGAMRRRIPDKRLKPGAADHAKAALTALTELGK